MHQLRVAVENGNHTLLLGERQAGKTTILRLLQWKMTEEAAQGVPVRCAYLNLAGLEPHEFFETLLRATIEQLHDPRLAAETQIPRPYTDAHFERDLGELLGYLAASLGPGVRLALLLDDADIILGYPQSTHIGLKRILSSPASAGLALILAGRDLLHSWSQTEPPFYSAFPTYPVSPLANDAAQRLVTQPVEGVFQYEPDALELILQTTQGRPAKIQTICQQLINDLLASGDQLVTADLVRAALGQTGLARAELLSQAGQLLEELLDWVEDHPGAPHPDLQAQIKRTWEALGRALVQGVRSIQR